MTFAIWTLYCHTLVIIAANFNQLLKMSWIPLVLSIILICLLPRLRFFQLALSPPIHYTKSTIIPVKIWLTSAFLIVAIYATGISYITFWLLAMCYLTGVFLFGTPLSLKHHKDFNRLSDGWQNVILGLLILCAVFVTLISNRPDADDAFYLNLAFSAIDHPAIPLLQFDGMYGEPGLPLLAYFYRVNSFELLIAVVSSVTKLSAAAIYYIYAPAIMAAFVVIAYWLALRVLSDQWTAIIGLAIAMLVLIAWGDVHRSYGNFSFVRLFQGKGILVSICIPAVIYYSSRYACYRDAYSWICLALTQVGAIGFSSSALVVAPTAAAFVLIGSWRPNRDDTKMLGLGLLSSLYVVCTAIFLIKGMAQEGENLSNLAVVTKPTFLTGQGLETVLGNGTRAYVALFALLTAPIFATSYRCHKMLSGTALAIVVLILNPLTAGLISKIIPNMYWRIFWSVPFPLWIGLLCGGLAMYVLSTKSLQLGIAIGVVLATVFTLLPGNWTVSSENHTKLEVPGYKVTQMYDAAKMIVELTPSGGSVLAPWNISELIPIFEHHPSVVAVRPHYLSIIRNAYGEDAAKTRYQMVQFISGVKFTKKKSEQILHTIELSGLATIVLPKLHSLGSQVADRLKICGYNLHTIENLDVWVFDGPPKKNVHVGSTGLRAR